MFIPSSLHSVVNYIGKQVHMGISDKTVVVVTK